jgi:hypothetical protein
MRITIRVVLDMHTKFWTEYLKGRHHSKDSSADERIILQWISGEWGGKVWTGFIWLRIRASGGNER